MLEVAGEVVADRGPQRQRATLALAYLVFARGRRVPADELAEAIWPDGPPTSWPASLRRLISDVRAWLGAAGLGDAISVAQQAYRLDLPPNVTIDVVEATMAMALPPDGGVGAEQAARAVGLVDADLLPGLDAPWLETRRGHVHRLRVDALEALAEALRVEGRLSESIGAAQDAIALDPLRESAYRVVMAAHREAGRIGSALRAYEECRARLTAELGSTPSAVTVAAYQSLLSPFSSDTGRPAVEEDDKAVSSFVHAAMSMETIASRTAIANLEGRLAALESAPHPDPIERVELLVELGQTRWALSGATDQLRRISLAAGEAALALGSPTHFGAAAALASTTTGVGLHDVDTEEMCRRALDAFGDEPGARARALALLSELRYGEEAVALAEDAVAIARAQGDPGLLLDTLLALDQALAWSPDLAARLAVEAECSSLLAHSSRWRTRPTFEPQTRLQAGDLEWFRGEVERLTELSRTSTQWEPRFYSIAFRGVLAHLEGDLATGFDLADELIAHSREEINAVHSASGLYLALTRDRGDVVELLPIIEGMAATSTGISSFTAAVVLGHSLAGHHERAQELLDEVIGSPLEGLPKDHIRPLTLGLLAEAVAVDGRASQAERLLVELDPFAGLLCTGAHATVLLGTVDGFRGPLAWRAGDPELAVRHLTDALALEERLGAPLLAARSHAWSALALRSLDRDPEAAGRHEAEARRLAVPAGTAATVERVLALGDR